MMVALHVAPEPLQTEANATIARQALSAFSAPANHALQVSTRRWHQLAVLSCLCLCRSRSNLLCEPVHASAEAPPRLPFWAGGPLQTARCNITRPAQRAKPPSRRPLLPSLPNMTGRMACTSRRSSTSIPHANPLDPRPVLAYPDASACGYGEKVSRQLPKL